MVGNDVPSRSASLVSSLTGAREAAVADVNVRVVDRACKLTATHGTA